MRRGLHAGRRGSGGLSLNVFTPDEIEDIHLATLEVLERTGVFVEDDEALDIFNDGRCIVDRENATCASRGSIVEEAIRSAPPKAIYAGRDPKNDFVLEANRVYFVNFDEGVKYVDPWTREQRDPTIKDVADCARLVDAMSDIDDFDIGGRRHRRAARDLRPARPRGGAAQHHQAGRLRGDQRLGDARNAPSWPAAWSAASTTCASDRSSASASVRSAR